ncbi:MAG: hypothetical protein QXX68_00765 [Candidatus Pacearchaeota archaeon]
MKEKLNELKIRLLKEKNNRRIIKKEIASILSNKQEDLPKKK